ncbi:hypothetical protein HMPREF3150_00157 [Pseudomonas aeruginosa]|nr:hypothetical protein HMPREF3150_00157 [Pseudomonas aeruginosa]PRW25825.1 hypothetical protein CSB96_5647 [Pseudomonas aeruginosa]
MDTRLPQESRVSTVQRGRQRETASTDENGISRKSMGIKPRGLGL